MRGLEYCKFLVPDPLELPAAPSSSSGQQSPFASSSVQATHARDTLAPEPDPEGSSDRHASRLSDINEARQEGEEQIPQSVTGPASDGKQAQKQYDKLRPDIQKWIDRLSAAGVKP